jgi:hypothetical protein
VLIDEIFGIFQALIYTILKLRREFEALQELGGDLVKGLNGPILKTKHCALLLNHRKSSEKNSVLISIIFFEDERNIKVFLKFFLHKIEDLYICKDFNIFDIFLT